MPEITINGNPVTVAAKTSVAAAILQQGEFCFRRSITGEPRAALCGMGICYECRVTINGEPHVLSCQTPCVDGLVVETA
jgi:aerobic-type carbon monoxide dehydrogenase small subunit (CoxS/CutS family)